MKYNKVIEVECDNGFTGKYDLLVDDSADRTLVVISERQDNGGPSVTNAIEEIATFVRTKVFTVRPPKPLVFVEHYPKTNTHEETFDLVEMQWGVYWEEYTVPVWHRTTKPAEME